MASFWLGTVTGTAAGGFIAWHLAIMSVKVDRARRGWKRKV